MIMDAERTRVLWWGIGNTAIRPFEQLGERCQQIEAVADDTITAFDLEKQHCRRRRWSHTCSVVARLWPRGGGR